MSAATWYVLPTSCLPGRSQQQPHPQHTCLCQYQFMNDNSSSSSASSCDAALLPGQLCHGEWAAPLPLGGSTSSSCTSGGSYAGSGYGLSESGAAVSMFGMPHAGAAASAATSPAAPSALRDTIADVLALLGGHNPKATSSSQAAFAEDTEPFVPRRTAKAGVCPPPPRRARPAVMLLPASEAMQRINGTAV